MADSKGSRIICLTDVSSHIHVLNLTILPIVSYQKDILSLLSHCLVSRRSYFGLAEDNDRDILYV